MILGEGFEAGPVLDAGPGCAGEAFGPQPASPQLFLAEEDTARYVYGVPPNLGHADDVYQALLPEIARSNVEALAYALDGTELSGTTAVSAGHSHVSGGVEHALPWLQLGSWRTATGLDSSNLTGTTVSWTTAAGVAMLGFVLPAGLSLVYPRVRWSASSVALTVEFQFIDPADMNASVATNAITLPDSGSGSRWYELGASNLAGIGTTNSRREVWCYVTAKVDTGSAQLWEVQVGARPGL